MKVTHSCAEFQSIMIVEFKFDNGGSVFSERHEAQRLEMNDVHLIVVTNDGEWVHFPVNCVSELRVQSLILANYEHTLLFANGEKRLGDSEALTTTKDASTDAADEIFCDGEYLFTRRNEVE